MALIRFDSKALLVSLAAVGIACGSTPPPRELVDARAAYQRAQGGPAVQLAPAQLDTAKQALTKAEESFREDGDTELTRDFSYIARRKAELAEATAGIEGAKRQKSQADKDFKKLQAGMTEAAQAKLAATQRRLEAAERAQKYMAEEAARAKAEAQKSKKQLEAERKAREAAEKQLAAALASLKVKKEARGVIITLEGAVLFASGKSQLLPIAQQKLDQVARALQAQGYKKIVVEGHTDSRGARDMNMALSLRRAEAVRSYLVSRGMDASKIGAVGLGPDRPIADNKSAEGRANNRRVELVVTPN